jgi:predicted phosphodiesterase
VQSKILLTADLHLTDKDEDAYRWDVFGSILDWCTENPSELVIIAGDLTDRKDRHSGVLVNMLADVLTEIAQNCRKLIVLRGNHDTPLSGTPYWSVLSHLQGVDFVDQPEERDGMWLLPYSPDPATDWASLDLRSQPLIIMHQTVTGVLGNNGHALINDKMPPLPASVFIWSGDIHTPQSVDVPGLDGADAGVNYIGSPHPINFGDKYECQMVELDLTMHPTVLQQFSLQKHMLDVATMAELHKAPTQPGDQARVRWHMAVGDVDQWPATQDAVRAWAKAAGVQLFGIEPVLDGVNKAATTQAPDQLLRDPAAILKAFLAAEKTPPALAGVAHDILTEMQGA